MKIVVHTLVRNEQNWIWYALNSIIDYVDEIMVWDNNSTDDTVKIIKSISSSKIKFHQAGDLDKDSFTKARQKMLEETSSDWIMMLDGDEIWPQAAISEAVDLIHSGKNLEYLVHPYSNLVGDVFHYQDESAGRYTIKD
ncbi:MAG: glycosyltransferase, partial [Patescibacteria group bacterium]